MFNEKELHEISGAILPTGTPEEKHFIYICKQPTISVTLGI